MAAWWWRMAAPRWSTKIASATTARRPPKRCGRGCPDVPRPGPRDGVGFARSRPMRRGVALDVVRLPRQPNAEMTDNILDRDLQCGRGVGEFGIACARGRNLAGERLEVAGAMRAVLDHHLAVDHDVQHAGGILGE